MLSLSRQGLRSAVKELEVKLGKTLFDVRGNVLYPTSAADELRLAAEPLLASYQEFLARCARISGRPATLEIAVSYGMPAALGDIANSDYMRLTDMMGDGFKEVYLRATDREVMQMVASGRTELGTVFAFEEDIAEFSDLEGRLLYSRPLFVMVHRDHPLAALEMLEVDDLRGVPFALGTQNSSCQRAFKESCRAHGFGLDVVFEDDDMEYANQLVEQNRCARLVCCMDAGEAKPPLVLLPFLDPTMRWQAYMIYRRSVALSDQAKRYLRMATAFAEHYPRV